MARREVRWSEDAERDLDDVIFHIAGDSPLDALRVFDRLHEQARKLETFAERGRRIPELAAHTTERAPLRELIVRPWRMFYSIEDRCVLVIAIVDSRRDFGAWLARRSGFGIWPPSSS